MQCFSKCGPELLRGTHQRCLFAGSWALKHLFEIQIPKASVCSCICSCKLKALVGGEGSLELMKFLLKGRCLTRARIPLSLAPFPSLSHCFLVVSQSFREVTFTILLWPWPGWSWSYPQFFGLLHSQIQLLLLWGCLCLFLLVSVL